jgi:hypothetical protein
MFDVGRSMFDVRLVAANGSAKKDRGQQETESP